MSVVATTGSVTHTYGNVACVAMEYIKSYFDIDFFKTIHMSTKMSNRQLDVFKAKHGFWVNQKPMLIMKPRIEMDDSDAYFYGSAMTNRITNSRLHMEFGNLVPIIDDPKWGVRLLIHWNRLKIIFDVAIVVNTFNQQVDLLHKLKNQLAPMTPFYLETPLETCVPRNIMIRIIKHLGLKETDTAEILKYLNTYGNVPFTYKLKSGSGNDEYFALYNTKIESVLSDLGNPDEGESDNLVTSTYVIPFSISMSFYGVGTWYAGLQDTITKYSVVPSDSEIMSMTDENHDPNRIVPLLSIPLGYDLKLPTGWRILNSPHYMVKDYGTWEKNGAEDITPFGDVIPSEYKELIKEMAVYNKYTNTPFDPFIKFRVFKGRYELPEGKKGYEIDIDKLEIHTYDCNPKETYRIFILVNTLMINTIASEVHNFSVPK